MKKTLFVMALLCLLSVSSFGIITGVQINVIEGQGAIATYDPVLGKLEFRQGAQATLYDSLGGTYVAPFSEITANFDGMVDSSSGGWAQASFANVLDWQIQFYDDALHTNVIGEISGDGVGGTSYDEIEGRVNELAWLPGAEPRIDADQLFGAGVVNVTQYDLAFAGGGEWEDVSGGLAKLKSHSILTGTIYEGFGDYDTDEYETSLSTVWLYADETTIPEPATMGLLGLGALLLRKRKV